MLVLTTLLLVATTSTSAERHNIRSRAIINSRANQPIHGRKLPCPNKCGGSSNVNCVGSFSSYSSCVASTGQQTRTYTHTTSKSGTGTACPHLNGYSQSINCDVNCVGSFSSFSTCDASTALQSRSYSITTSKQHSGSDCTHANGATQEQACDVNCQVVAGAWSACVDGTRSRSWTVQTKSQNGGATCSAAGAPSAILNENGATATEEDTTCTDPNQPCMGEWGVFGACDSSTSQKSRTYSVTQLKSGSGATCSFADGSIQTESCVPDIDCVGDWSAWGKCGAAGTAGEKQKTFSITQAASGNGNGCPHANNAIQTAICPIALIDWDYYIPKSQWNTHLLQQRPLPNSTEMKMVTCPLDSMVRIQWEQTETTHDVWEVPGDAEFAACDFNAVGATRLSAVGAKSGQVDITCDGSVGPRYFSCSMGDACDKGLQRIRIHTTDPSKTAALRLKSYQENGVTRTHSSLAKVFEEHLIHLTYNGHTLDSDVEADEILAQLRSVATNAPESCSDWIKNPTENECKAFAFTDMGFIERIRPTPNFDRADENYAQAIELDNGLYACAAQAYRTELMLAQSKSEEVVDEQFKAVCSACKSRKGSEMLLVQLAFARGGVAVEKMPTCDQTVNDNSDGGNNDDKSDSDRKKKNTVVKVDQVASNGNSTGLGEESMSDDLGSGGVVGGGPRLIFKTIVVAAMLSAWLVYA